MQILGLLIAKIVSNQAQADDHIETLAPLGAISVSALPHMTAQHAPASSAKDR